MKKEKDIHVSTSISHAICKVFAEESCLFLSFLIFIEFYIMKYIDEINKPMFMHTPLPLFYLIIII